MSTPRLCNHSGDNESACVELMEDQGVEEIQRTDGDEKSKRPFGNMASVVEGH